MKEPEKLIEEAKEARKAHITGTILKIMRGAMTGIVYSLEAKDEYSRLHSERVAEMSRRFSLILGNDKTQTEQVYLAASVHDIGKIGIPDAVLLCPGKLDEDQWKIMQSHTKIGAEILTKTAESLRKDVREEGYFLPIPKDVIEQIEEVRKGILHHHERWDGKGYPERLSKADIPYISRLIALCDSTDAMMSKRVYRNALSAEVCKEEIKKNAGIMYDPDLTKIFEEHFFEITDGLFSQLVTNPST